jgi:propanol-preferring alcohol dehydrogenase
MTMPSTMRAMVLHAPGEPLRAETRAVPRPGPEGVLLRVLACGICRTDLHVVDGELREPRLPLVPGHQIVGEVVARGARVAGFAVGRAHRRAVARRQLRRLRFLPRRRGEPLRRRGLYRLPGRRRLRAVLRGRRALLLRDPARLRCVQAAPLLCAGLIGYRSYRPARAARRIGFYGFGAAAHILVQVARHHGQEVYAFTRPGDQEAQDFARRLGAVWAGDSSAPAPVALDAAIIFAPEGELVPRALRAVRKGGRVICAGIHMSDIPSFAYADLWGERHIESVANLTRRDGEEFLPLAAALPVRTEVHRYALADVNRALDDLRAGRFTGAAVVIP